MLLSPYKQTQLVIWTNQILFFICLLFFFESWVVFLSIISLYVFGCMSEISLHRFFTHKSYKTSKFKHNLLCMFAFLTGQGPILSWVTVHRTHHAYEDTDKDPHSPYHLTWWKIYLAFLPKYYNKNLVIDLIKSKYGNYFIFENNCYYLMWVVLWVILLFVNFYLFYFIVAGSALWYIATCIVNIFSHRYFGIKNFNESVGYNSNFINLITGVGHHNNHHKFPKNYTYSVSGEIDIYGWIIKRFFILKNDND